MDRPNGRRVRKFDGPSGQGLWYRPQGDEYKVSVTELAFYVIWHDKHSADWLATLTTKGGNCGMVHEIYDSLFFLPYFSFPLEGERLEEAKGVQGRAPIGYSIAVLTANRRPPERSDAQNGVSRFPFRGQ